MTASIKACFLLAAILLPASFIELPGQNIRTVDVGKEYTGLKADGQKFAVRLEKGSTYGIFVLQQRLDVVIALSDQEGNRLLEMDSPNGSRGFERLEYAPERTGLYYILIARFDDTTKVDTGKVSLSVKRYSRAELEERTRVREEIERENRRNVLTLDVDHFWQAFDDLKNRTTYFDSALAFHELYIERATDGLKAFIKARGFTADQYVNRVARYPKFFNAVRENTFQAKRTEPDIESIYQRFKAIYPNFKPFKVSFAIGNVGTGGTVADGFVLIGAEVTMSNSKVDLSEFEGNAFSEVLSAGEDIREKIRIMVAHECVHTQQIPEIDSAAVDCPLLYACMQEGFCDFIGELVVGSQINGVAHEYGNMHERELWQEFKASLCSEEILDWLYNYENVTDRPADLGYYIGYRIAQHYYANAKNKEQAVIDIIEMRNPMRFLEESGYDRKFR